LAAHTVQCQRCGALIAMEQLVAAVTCSHCGTYQHLDGQRIAHLQHYQQRVASDVRAAADHRANAAQAAASQEQVSSGSNVALAFGFMLGIPVVVAVAGSILIAVGVIPTEYQPWVSFGAIAGAMVGLLLYLIKSLVGRGKGAGGAGAGHAVISCPHCGASHSYRHGQALDQCSYCGAALMPSATVMQVGLDAARNARRRAQMEHWRKERSLVASYQNMGVTSEHILLIAFGPMALMMGVGAIGFSYDMLFGDEPYSHGIFVLWLMVFATIAGGVLGYRWLQDRKRRMRDASVALAHQLRGQPIDALGRFVHWLNQFWAAQYDNTKLSVAGLYGGAHGSIDGYAVAAECSTSSDKYRAKRVQLFIAAYIPGPSDGGPVPQHLAPAAEQERQWLLHHGYRCHISAGGVRLQAQRDTTKYLAKHLDQIARLAPVLHHGCLLARALGGVPVEALP
jgi:hypothetical protein